MKHANTRNQRKQTFAEALFRSHESRRGFSRIKRLLRSIRHFPNHGPVRLHGHCRNAGTKIARGYGSGRRLDIGVRAQIERFFARLGKTNIS